MKRPTLNYVLATLCFLSWSIGFAAWLGLLWAPQTTVAMFGHNNNIEHHVAVNTQGIPQSNTNNI